MEVKSITLGTREVQEFVKMMNLFTKLMKLAHEKGVRLSESEEKELIAHIEKVHREIYG